jgi:release factor glutamine methyltransferase
VSEQNWTVRSLLEWSTTFLTEREIDSPRLTAELLLADVLKTNRIGLYVRFDQPMDTPELAAFRGHLQRRSRKEPTQYILGTQDFWSLTFKVDSRVLIPRPETECIIEEVQRLVRARSLAGDGEFLDLCTGSGAIACALAAEFPFSDIHASDISKEALALAKENAEDNGLEQQISFFQGSLFEALPEVQYDLIATNPPYIRHEEMETLQEEVRLFEPHLALDGGKAGMDLIEQILHDAHRYLKPGGVLLMEIGSSQGQEALEAVKKAPELEEARLLQDYAQLDRILCCRRTSSLPSA